VVLGGGIAGMLAARVLTDTFEQVTVIERHVRDLAGRTGSGPLDDRASAAPPLAQVLSERARPQLERLFLHLPAELTADGAAVVVPFSKPRPTTASESGENRSDARLQFTQPFIQRHLSRRLTSLDAIAMLHGCDAVGLVSNGRRCVGVQILPRSQSAAARSMPADLVVDAMGTGSRLCVWLDDIWRIRIPTTIATAIAGSRPVGPASSANSARIGRRRFDRVRHLPAGIVALGGSVCSIDPFYAQDFDVAVLEAAALGRILGDQNRYGAGSHSIELPRRYFRAVSQILDSACDADGPRCGKLFNDQLNPAVLSMSRSHSQSAIVSIPRSR
jgi:NAD(P)-binding Rossmann-like domain